MTYLNAPLKASETHTKTVYEAVKMLSESNVQWQHFWLFTMSSIRSIQIVYFLLTEFNSFKS